MGHIRAFTQRIIGQPVCTVRLGIVLHVATKRGPNGLNSFGASLFVQCDADLGGANFTQVNTLLYCGIHHDALQRANLNGNRVKEDFWLDVKTKSFQTLSQPCRFAVHGLGDRFDPIWPVIDCVH